MSEPIKIDASVTFEFAEGRKATVDALELSEAKAKLWADAQAGPDGKKVLPWDVIVAGISAFVKEKAGIELKPSEAVGVYKHADAAWKKGELGRAHRRDARLARFFGPAVLRMTALEKAVLDENVAYLQACETLEEVDKGIATLHPDTLYDVVLRATDNERLANSYRVSAIRARQRPTAAEG